MAFADDIRSFVRRSGAPVSMALIASWVVMSLLFFLIKPTWFGDLMLGADLSSRPWSLFTYSFAYAALTSGFGLIGLIFMVWWMLFAGAAVEREVGSARFAVAWFAFQTLAGLALFLGSSLLSPMGRMGLAVSGPYLPLAAITVAWGTRNPESRIMMYGVLPLAGKWLAWLTVGIVFFGYGFPNPLVGLLACAHLGVAYLFAANKIPNVPYRQPVMRLAEVRAQRERDQQLEEEVRRRRQEREERERLRKLFERSMKDDPEGR